MTKIIEGKQADVKDVRAFDDGDSTLPNQVLTCSCGGTGFTVVDDDSDMVQCTACSAVIHAGEVAATLRVFRDYPDPDKPDKDSLCLVTDELGTYVEDPDLLPDGDKKDKVKKVKIKE